MTTMVDSRAGNSGTGVATTAGLQAALDTTVLGSAVARTLPPLRGRQRAPPAAERNKPSTRRQNHRSRRPRLLLPSSLRRAGPPTSQIASRPPPLSRAAAQVHGLTQFFRSTMPSEPAMALLSFPGANLWPRLHSSGPRAVLCSTPMAVGGRTWPWVILTLHRASRPGMMRLWITITPMGASPKAQAMRHRYCGREARSSVADGLPTANCLCAGTRRLATSRDSTSRTCRHPRHKAHIAQLVYVRVYNLSIPWDSMHENHAFTPI